MFSGKQSLSDRLVIMGEPIAQGFAVGRILHFQDILTRESTKRDLNAGQVEGELSRLKKAIDKAHIDLGDLKSKVTYEIDAKHAAIFSAHQLILKDIELFNDIENGLRQKLLNVEQIVQEVFGCWERKVRCADTEDFHERANDVIDVGKRLLKALAGDVKEFNMTDLLTDGVIFAKILLPSDTASLNIKNIKAIVTIEGTQNSHSAILARALDIPFVSKIDGDISAFPHGTRVIVDGKIGTIIINPWETEIETYTRLIQRRLTERRKVVRRACDVLLEINAKRIKVAANVSSCNDIKMAKIYGADAIGLYRTGPLYMDSPNLPTEAYLFDHLTRSLELVRDQDINLRLLDMGGDKRLPFLGAVECVNPALGLNGIRLLLKYPHLLEVQLRVFLRLSATFKVKISVPMVTLPKDMIDVRRYLLKEKEKLIREKIPFNEGIQMGAMIETPSALMLFDELLELSDFFNIGTNDMVQYVMAAGREDIDVVDYYKAGNPIILKALKEVIRKSEERGKEISICGELAGNLDFTKALLDIGLRNFSVQPAFIPYVKNKIFGFLKDSKVHG